MNEKLDALLTWIAVDTLTKEQFEELEVVAIQLRNGSKEVCGYYGTPDWWGMSDESPVSATDGGCGCCSSSEGVTHVGIIE